MTWAAIGVIVGFLLGLTGAGGAVIAVPLFTHWVETPIREATVLSLLAVLIGAGLSWLVQIRKTEFFLSAILFVGSIVGSTLFKPLKSSAPELVIQLLFVATCLVSVWSLWKKPPGNAKPSGTPGELAGPPILLKGLIGGLALGALVTMTGLGGGVLLIPLLSGVLGLTLERAAATSLLTIFLSAGYSISIQSGAVAHHLTAANILALASGSVASALAVKALLKNVPSRKLDAYRRGIVTVVIGMSVIGILLVR